MYITLIAIGLVSGLFHGYFNNDIYHNSHPYKNKYEKIHTIWIHIVSAVVGSSCLYFLVSKFVTLNKFSESFGLADFGILIVGLLGIVGLLPMTLWFTVLSINKIQDSFLELINKMFK
jgi:hypothetical protein